MSKHGSAEHPTVLGRMLNLCQRNTNQDIGALIKAVDSRLSHEDADLREVAIEFVGDLFKIALSGEALPLTLLQPLALLAARKTCHDQERSPAVRACSLVTLTQIGLHRKGVSWLADAIDLRQTLQQALECSGMSCVRRAALELLQVWVATSTPEHTRTIAVSALMTQRETLASLARDGDWEVKRCTMMLAGNILKISYQETHKQLVSPLLSVLDCCGLLMCGIQDFDREVRHCSAICLLAIVSEHPQKMAMTKVQLDREQLETLVRQNSPEAPVVDRAIESSQVRDGVMECY